LFRGEKKGGLNKAQKVRAPKGLGLNMKRFSASNAEGEGSPQVYGFKAKNLPEVHGPVLKLTLKRGSHNGQDIVIILSKGKSIGCPAVLKVVIEEILLPWMEAARKPAEEPCPGRGNCVEVQEPALLLVDGDAEQLQVFQELAARFCQRVILIGKLDASTTGYVQPEDVSPAYKGMHADLDGEGAHSFERDSLEKLERWKAQLVAADTGLSPLECEIIASGVLRMQYVDSKYFTAINRKNSFASRMCKGASRSGSDGGPPRGLRVIKRN
jgi:hypothetical protein